MGVDIVLLVVVVSLGEFRWRVVRVETESVEEVTVRIRLVGILG